MKMQGCHKLGSLAFFYPIALRMYNDLILLYMLTIVAPKGDRASFAILKHCSPKGIPMMVQHSNTPFSSAASANGIPLKSIQNKLAIKDIVPLPYCTSLPKGQKAREANLKHCRPMGIPIIVIHHKMPARIHERPCHNPPHKNQMIFPKQPIIFHLLFQSMCAR